MVSLTERGRRLRDPYWWLNRVQRPFAFVHRRISSGGIDGGNVQIVFLIKLIGRKDASDWEGVARRLQATLDSVGRQTADRVSVFLCGQDLPEGVSCQKALHFIQAPEKLQRIQGIDKQAKHRIGARAMVDQLEGPAYVVLLDADDIVHPDLSGFLQRDSNGRGYHIEDGYMWDVKRPLVTRLSLDSCGMPFHEMCGSCAAIAVDFSDKRTAKRILCTLPMNHQVLSRHMTAMGQPIDPVPFPCMLYGVNHEDNASSKFGRDGARSWLFSEHGVEGYAAKDVLRDFGVEIAAEPQSPVPA
ncbi:glycosyltransferase family A protein [Tropicimonas marinistellae]|uniref:glycosyltransferase family A protein n=1 Tax=Tropicimonas marinistellae TaxID=1739787 RepID=UPI00082CFD19|nr:glycosyltransferase family A protein [Tropicimonas marinistellae]